MNRYHDFVAARLGAAARAKLEALMKAGNFQPQSEFGKKWYAKGEAEGETRGKVEGKIESLLAVLAARGLPISSAQRERIESCRDLETLDRWLWRAVTASTVDDTLG